MRVSDRLMDGKKRKTIWLAFSPWTQSWALSPMSCFYTSNPTLMSIDWNTCSWWWKVDCSFADTFCLILRHIGKLQCEFWCQVNGELSPWLICPLQNELLLVYLPSENLKCFQLLLLQTVTKVQIMKPCGIPRHVSPICNTLCRHEN